MADLEKRTVCLGDFALDVPVRPAGVFSAAGPDLAGLDFFGDLELVIGLTPEEGLQRAIVFMAMERPSFSLAMLLSAQWRSTDLTEIGRASCRERV